MSRPGREGLLARARMGTPCWQLLVGFGPPSLPGFPEPRLPSHTHSSPRPLTPAPYAALRSGTRAQPGGQTPRPGPPPPEASVGRTAALGLGTGTLGCKPYCDLRRVS